MKRLECPHCHETKISHARFAKDVVVVMQCPSCDELIVMFREKVVGLDRSILEHGEKEERKMHLATVIAEFLDPEFLDIKLEDLASGIGLGTRAYEGDAGDLAEIEEDDSPGQGPISDAELRSFRRDELKQLDDTEYFKRFFS